MMRSWITNAFLSVAKRWRKADVDGENGGGSVAGRSPEHTHQERMRLGREAVTAGQYSTASDHFNLAVTAHPGDSAARIALGFSLIEQGRYAEAKPHLSRALLLDSKDADASYLFGKCCLETGEVHAAITHFSEALTLNPDFEFALRDLSRALFQGGRKDDARALISKGVAQYPESADFHFYQGNLCVDERRLEDAIACYDRALKIDPDYAEVHDNISHALVELGRPEQAVASARRALELRPGYLAAYNNMLWAMLFLQGQSNGEYLAEARKFGEKALAAAVPFATWHGNQRAATAQLERSHLRVGLVSGDLRVHAVGFLLEGVLPKLHSANLELIAYSMNPADDGLTERLKGHFSDWTSIVGMSDEEAARKIHADGIDVLIDLAGHTAHNRLPVFAWKPAPLQLSWLGYLASTGVPGIDFVLADAVSAPSAVRMQFTEQVWCLPETFNCFTPPLSMPSALAVTPAPALRNGYVSFGSFQRMNKINERALSLWARILMACPTAVLRLQNAQFGDPHVRQRILNSLQRKGVDPDRVRLAGEIAKREDYLAAYAQVDIVLDTHPYPGVTTTGEALWMGVPTVTLAGDTLLSRVGASLLTCAGLAQWVAWSDDEYVSLAVRQSSDLEGLARLRAGLRQKVAGTALFDAGRFAQQFEDALFAMWQSRQV